MNSFFYILSLWFAKFKVIGFIFFCVFIFILSAVARILRDITYILKGMLSILQDIAFFLRDIAHILKGMLRSL